MLHFLPAQPATLSGGPHDGMEIEISPSVAQLFVPTPLVNGWEADKIQSEAVYRRVPKQVPAVYEFVEVHNKQ